MQANYSKNELRKLDEQKAHELDLVKTEYENVKNNLIRQHKKNEDELKNLHEAKVKRLTYEIEEKKHEIEEGNNRLKRSGKEGEAEIARLINENANLRNELKENDNRNRTRIEELTAFYESQFSQELETNLQRESNLRTYYEN
jgi:seryl-tRNA synthetase